MSARAPPSKPHYSKSQRKKFKKARDEAVTRVRIRLHVEQMGLKTHSLEDPQSNPTVFSKQQQRRLEMVSRGVNLSSLLALQSAPASVRSEQQIPEPEIRATPTPSRSNLHFPKPVVVAARVGNHVRTVSHKIRAAANRPCKYPRPSPAGILRPSEVPVNQSPDEPFSSDPTFLPSSIDPVLFTDTPCDAVSKCDFF